MYEKYKIILTPFPFTDLSSSKVRPAVILSGKPVADDVVIAFISSRAPKNRAEFSVSIKRSDSNNLKLDSVVRVSKIATVDKKIILGEIGELESNYQIELDKALKNLFAL